MLAPSPGGFAPPPTGHPGSSPDSRTGGGALGKRPSRSNFFYFHAMFGENLAK